MVDLALQERCNHMDIILASLSPRRKELLQKITPNFTVIPSTADETLPFGISPKDAVEFLAAKKALEIFTAYPHCCVIGADTVVAIDGEILGKPENAEDAMAMLQKLSGNTHYVHTGFSVMTPNDCITTSCQTEVLFYPLTTEQIEDYVSTGEPMDKAGAYGIQERGALLVKSITGDYFNVMGLPIATLYRTMIDLRLISTPFL